MQKPKPWADGPFELLPLSMLGPDEGVNPQPPPSVVIAEEMMIVHNTLLRGINAIYLQCVNVEASPADVNDFVHFARLWGVAVQHHHDNEEELAFPMYEKGLDCPGLMEKNTEQHHAFHDGLQLYTEYLLEVENGKQNFDGEKLRTVIDSFMPVLREHLSDEIDSLLALKAYEDKVDLLKLFKEIHAAIMERITDADKYEFLPLFLSCHEAAYPHGVNTTWPAVPWYVMLVFKWVFVPKNKHLWRFAPCQNRARRELPFA